MFQEQLANEAPLGESPPSPESMSIERYNCCICTFYSLLSSSNLDSSRREAGAHHLDTELELDGDEPDDELDESEMADRKRFERLIQDKM